MGQKVDLHQHVGHRTETKTKTAKLSDFLEVRQLNSQEWDPLYHFQKFSPLFIIKPRREIV